MLKGNKEFELTSIEWLLDHHEAKERERSHMISDLEIARGDRVLDAGCGPGLWSEMFAQRVAPCGSVTGIDVDNGLLEVAKKRNAGSKLEALIAFENAKLEALPYTDDSFDVAFCGNTLQYLEDPSSGFEELKRVTKPGGRIYDKSFDGSVLVFYPMDNLLQQDVLNAVAKSLKANPPKQRFNNFFGRENREFFLNHGITNVTTKSYVVEKHFPLTGAEIRYITSNADWYIETAAPLLSQNQVEAWQQHFNENSTKYIFNKEGFYYCMLEVITGGTIGGLGK